MQTRLPGSVLDRLMQPVHGQGGFQDLVRKLQEQVEGASLTLTAADVEKIRNYCKGQGGFQDLLTSIAEVAGIPLERR